MLLEDIAYFFMRVVESVLAAFIGAAAVEKQAVVPGAAFDRFAAVWFENTDYEKAAGDPNFKWAASQGITLTNYFALTHPSQPNYFASAGGDHYAMLGAEHYNAPSNISTIVDLLEDKQISWCEYQENMPYNGFTGDFRNPKTKANMYVRKHNPLVHYRSITDSPSRSAKMKTLRSLDSDMWRERVPQWIFITPDMISSGHDSSITVAGEWMRKFMEPLMKNKHIWDKTLFLITFDEVGNYGNPNRVFTVLMGGAVPEELKGTTDPSLYSHYSMLSTVQANWGLHTLGRFDVGANVFQIVANKTGDMIREPPQGIDKVGLKHSYPGHFGKTFDTKDQIPIPPPNIDLVANGRTVLPSIRELWKDEFKKRGTYYKGEVVPPSDRDPPTYI